jgi:pimeloyl-ACP methyl ester carboxylesterase
MPAGIPTLVLLPGLDGRCDQFAPLAAALGAAVELVVARYPTDGVVDIPAHAAAARAVLPTHRSYVLLGESFAGPMAIRIAATAPVGLAGLILCASYARCPRPSLRLLRPLRGVIAPAAVPVWRMASVVLGGSPMPPATRMLARSTHAASAGALRSRVASVFDVDARDDLERVAIPVLYLRATRDRLVPKSAARDIQAIARQTTVVEIAAPHFVLQAAPAAAASAIRRFMGVATQASTSPGDLVAGATPRDERRDPQTPNPA